MRYFLFSILYLLSSLYNMSSGDCTVIPGYEFAGDPADRVTKSKLNLGFNPAVRLNEGSVGSRELVPDDVAEIVRNDAGIGNILSYATLKNVIINPQFDFWTRPSTVGPYSTYLADAGSHRYCADRWVIANSTGRTWSRATFPVGQTDVPDFPKYMLHWSQAAPLNGNANPGYLAQRVAGVRTFSGEQVTWAIYVRAQTAITAQMQLSQFFGFAGSPSAAVDSTAQSYVLVPNVWTKLVYTITLPSVAGKIVGTDGLDWLEARCIMPQGAAFEVDFAHAQLQLGDSADAFEHRLAVVEASLCNLFFERTQAVFASSLATHYPCFYFNTPKRNIPTLYIESISAGTGATIQPLSINGFYQDTANSEIGIGVVLADAELL